MEHVKQPNDLNDLLAAVVAAVSAAADALIAVQRIRPTTGEEVRHATAHNDAVAEAVLRPSLQRAHPFAQWAGDELGEGLLPPGDWWVVDPVEGNINLVQGTSEWGVSVTLVRDNVAILTAVIVPVVGEIYTAVRGHGATVNARPLTVSVKDDLGSALVGTGQAKPDESAEVHWLLGRSVVAMLDAALLVRVSVPSTLQLLAVASGASDAFWQHSRVRSGLLAGALLVEEAGGLVTDLHGQPWTLESADFLASGPGIHNAMVRALSSVSLPEFDGAR